MMDRFDDNMILYRPVGLQEMALIYDSEMKAFPARLPQQPIFYPVLQLEYARQTASGWNAQNGQFAGYVTQFKVEDPYLSRFETHTVGESQHQELWIPAEEIEEFNRHIIGHIKLVEAHFGNAFQGFVPESFGLQGESAVEQFTLLANSYLYKPMDFYLEIKRNHKAVFLNYPFWQTYAFKNPSLKGKILQAIKEAWLTAFPKTPLPLPPPVPADNPLVKQTHSLVDPVRQDIALVEQPDADADSWVDPVQEDLRPVEQTDADADLSVNPVQEATAFVKQTHSFDPAREDITPVEQADSPSLINPVREQIAPVEKTVSPSWMNPVPEETALPKPTDSHSGVNPVHEDITPVERTDPYSLLSPVHEDLTPAEQTDSHFVQGIELGFSGKYREAIDELSRAIQEDPNHVIAHTSLGVAFHQLGEDERALDYYEAALQIDPRYAEAHYFRANILYGHGNVREAIAGYTLAIGLNPELIEAHQEPVPPDRLTDYSSLPAEMYWIAKPAHRILHLDKLLESNPGQANLLKERAAEYYRLGNYEAAIMDYSSFLAIQPDDSRALHLRGVAYEQLGQFDRALEDYQRAIALNPQLADVYIQRGVTLGKSGNFRQSIASLTEGIRLAPNNPDGYFNRGTSYFQLGDFESAIADFSMVIRLSSNDEAAYYWRGISNEQISRQREAIADYRQFLRLSQDPLARQDVEQRLSQWNKGKQDSPDTIRHYDPRSEAEREGRHVSSRSIVTKARQEPNQAQSEKQGQDLDLYSLITVLGERGLNSTWFGSGVECYGEKAEELYAFTDHNRPIEGHDLLRITSGIKQTSEGDFHAFDPGATSHWIFIRAWDGSGFYIETNDSKSKERLKTLFQSVEDVDGVTPPYQGLFIRI
jgi:tetratricopeptide (TPR) repeat protein